MRRVAVLVGVLAALVAAVFPSGVARAEPGLDSARPGPDSVVGGEITEITLYYRDFISAIGGLVVGPDGRPLDATFAVDSEIQATVTLAAPLEQPGVYTVSHIVSDAEGRQFEAEYRFTFDPAASPPQLVVLPAASEVSWVAWGVGLVGALVIAVFAFRLIGSIRKANLRS